MRKECKGVTIHKQSATKRVPVELFHTTKPVEIGSVYAHEPVLTLVTAQRCVTTSQRALDGLIFPTIDALFFYLKFFRVKSKLYIDRVVI